MASVREAREAERRVVAAFATVLPAGVDIKMGVPAGDGLDGRVDLRIGDVLFEVTRVARGWPSDVSRFLAMANRLQGHSARTDAPQTHLVVVAPEMSPGARSLLESQGVGWVDETGASRIAVGSLVVSRDSVNDVVTRSRPSAASVADPPGVPGWRVATLAVAEALLLGVRPTQTAVAQAVGLSTATAARALALLADTGLLTADAGRGSRSARRLVDREPLLTAYIAAERRLVPRHELRVGVLWRDPVASAAEFIAGNPGAMATGVLAAAVMAPYLGEVTTSEIYLPVASAAELRAAAAAAGLRSSAGGRLLLRSSPGRGTEELTVNAVPPIVTDTGVPLQCAPWPRVFADLRRIGVRGEEAADHLLSLQPDPTCGPQVPT